MNMLTPDLTVKGVQIIVVSRDFTGLKWVSSGTTIIVLPSRFDRAGGLPPRVTVCSVVPFHLTVTEIKNESECFPGAEKSCALRIGFPLVGVTEEAQSRRASSSARMTRE